MRSIRSRLLILLLAGLTIVLVAGGVGVYWIERSSLMKQFDDNLLARAQTVASLAKSEPVMVAGELRIRNVFEGEDGPLALLEQTYFEYYFEGGWVRHRLDMTEPVLGFRFQGEDQFVIDNLTLADELKLRCIWLEFIPRADDDDWSGIDASAMTLRPLVVAVALNREPVDRALATLAGALLTVGGVLWLTMATLVFVGVGWGLRPLNRLRRQLSRISGERGAMVAIDGHRAARELRPVYDELNRMLVRVEQTLERERSFAGAAAHELRTPLAELRSTAEVALRWPDSSRAHAAIEESLAIGREMEQLVESLLLISRGQATRGDMALKPVPVQPIVKDCISRAQQSISRRRLNVAMDLPDDDTLPGSPEAVEIILRNLIDNAVHYTPEGGSIAIRDGHPNNGISSVVVENGPVSLEECDLDWLFRPFWQKEKSRTNRRHIGLGLAVVRQAAEACKLSVEATLAGDRLCVTVEGVGSNGTASPPSK